MRMLKAAKFGLAAVAGATLVACGGGGGGGIDLKHGDGQDWTTTQVNIVKFYDTNRNGVWDAGEPEITGWKMDTDKTGSTVRYTYSWFNEDDGLTAGMVTVREFAPTTSSGGTWVFTGAYLGSGNPSTSSAGSGAYLGQLTFNIADKTSDTAKFGNVCMGGQSSGGRTPGFWSNRNGAAAIAAAGTSAMLDGLSALHLVNADGSEFNPASVDALSSWLRGSNAQNMANQLSRHLAAAWLNVHAGDVVGSATVDTTSFGIPGTFTIDQILAMADAALAADGMTPAGDPNRATQEALKNVLDYLNNNGVAGGAVLAPSACTFGFGASS